MSTLTHLNDDGEAHMVDVSAKAVTAREAVAESTVVIAPEVIRVLVDGQVPKGDAIAVARIAGINATKRTADLIPLCHPIAVHGVEVEFDVDTDRVRITTTVRTADRTGVEMEALTAASVAGLALIDMVKGLDRLAHIADVRLLAKRGGRSGEWTRPQ